MNETGLGLPDGLINREGQIRYKGEGTTGSGTEEKEGTQARKYIFNDQIEFSYNLSIHTGNEIIKIETRLN